jgi:hypothetical protein
MQKIQKIYCSLTSSEKCKVSLEKPLIHHLIPLSLADLFMAASRFFAMGGELTAVVRHWSIQNSWRSIGYARWGLPRHNKRLNWGL